MIDRSRYQLTQIGFLPGHGAPALKAQIIVSHGNILYYEFGFPGSSAGRHSPAG